MANAILALALFVAAVFPQPGFAQGAASSWGWSRNKPTSAEAVSAQPLITAYAGYVIVSREGIAKPIRVESAPLAIKPGDSIRTGEDGSATLQLQDSSQIRLDPRSEFVLQEESSSGVSLSLSLGKLWAWVAKDRNRPFEVRTPFAVASVRGTSFSVEMTAAKAAVTEVYEGAVAVEALKNGAPSGREALLLAGQHVEAIGGKLSEVKTIVKPDLTPGKKSPASKRKASLENQLKRIAEGKDADRAASAQQALKSGDMAKMSAVADAAANSAKMSSGQQTMLAEAFERGRALGAMVPAAEQPGLQGKLTKQVSQAMAKWDVNREVGFQLNQQVSRSLMARGALSPAASPASAQVAMAAYQQQYAQNYFANQQALRQTVQRSAEPIPNMNLTQMPGQAARQFQMPLSPTASVFQPLSSSGSSTSATGTTSSASTTGGTTTSTGGTVTSPSPSPSPLPGSGTCICVKALACTCP